MAEQGRTPSPAPTEPPNTAAAASHTSPASHTQGASAPGRAEQVAALVDRIEATLKGSLPTLSVGLADRSGAASVEITRTAKGEVAVRICSRHGARSALTASSKAISSELASRGLRVKSLEIV
ncbi:MAG: hypothetical protein HY901_34085 [Deltaproteobacteria bacterium]|nr:hypothetical protein [Deltaproteobacteria bacterium]